MVNKQKLKAAIIANDGNQQKLADSMGISIGQLSLRINGHMDFFIKEVSFIRDRYNLTDAEVMAIFFDD